MALASASVNPLPLSFACLPSLIVMPVAGLLGSFRFETAQPNSVLRPARSESFTVLAEIGFPVLGLIVDSR